jgi:hypothetical protein
MSLKTEHTETFWRAFAESRGNVDGDYVVVAFGDSPALATELAALVVGAASEPLAPWSGTTRVHLIRYRRSETWSSLSMETAPRNASGGRLTSRLNRSLLSTTSSLGMKAKVIVPAIGGSTLIGDTSGDKPTNVASHSTIPSRPYSSASKSSGHSRWSGQTGGAIDDVHRLVLQRSSILRFLRSC